MKITRSLPYALVSLGLAASLAAQTSGASPKEQQKQATQQYQRGLDAINAAQWAKAEVAMAQAQTVLAKLQSKDASGALYWEAYAAAKQGERAKAMAALARLQQDYDHSDWRQDAAALRMQLDLQRGVLAPPLAPVSPLPALAPAPPGWHDSFTLAPGRRATNDADELKLLALNGLMNTEPSKALPLLEKVINGNSDATVKDRALFVLAQSNSPSAIATLTHIAQSNSDTSVREHAVRYLGMMGGQKGAAALAQIYATTNSIAVKRSILRSYMVGGDTTQLIAAAKAEQNQKLRSEAIRELGLSGSPQALAALTGLYQGARDRNASDAVIQALFLHGSAQALVTLARKETDPRLKEDIVQKLSLMHDPIATAYLEELLKQ